ncbi:3-deoxy-7-phosphoheptulonate synthase, partial [Klebsiella pneumoniae]
MVYRDAHHFPAFSPRKKQIFETPMNKTDELRTARIESLVTPAELAQRHPVTAD